MNPTAPTPELPDKLRDLFEQYVAAGRLELPFLPTTATQVLGACNEGSCDARELSELIQTDQSLAGHVLRIANSAAYAPLEPIVSLQQATSRLGVQAICEIALAVSMKGRVFKVPGYQTKVRAMWVHSAMAGCYAKEIARKIRHNVEGAFLCGLLHDVGKPVVMQGFLDILKDMTTEKVPFPLLELAMDVFHERVGGILLENWKLPDWVGEAVRHHHHYEDADDHPQEAMIAHLSDHLSHWAADEEAEGGEFDMRLPVLNDLNIYREDLQLLLERREVVLEAVEPFL